MLDLPFCGGFVSTFHTNTMCGRVIRDQKDIVECACVCGVFKRTEH